MKMFSKAQVVMSVNLLIMVLSLKVASASSALRSPYLKQQHTAEESGDVAVSTHDESIRKLLKADGRDLSMSADNYNDMIGDKFGDFDEIIQDEILQSRLLQGRDHQENSENSLGSESSKSKWNCFKKTDLEFVRQVEIDWGHTSGDAEWACNNWSSDCGNSPGGCQASPSGASNCGPSIVATMTSYDNLSSDDSHPGCFNDYCGTTPTFLDAVPVVAIHANNWPFDKYHNIEIKRSNGAVGIVQSWDFCADEDCPNGSCCTTNANIFGGNYLVDLERRTLQRLFGVTTWDGTREKVTVRICDSFDPAPIANKYGLKK
jgi:hypothetical protein